MANKTIRAQGASNHGNFLITGKVVYLMIGDERVKFFIHTVIEKHYKGDKKILTLTHYSTGARFGIIPAMTGTTQKDRAQHLINEKIEQHGLERVRTVISQTKVINHD